ncbi:glutathione S-transferase family protein [Sphingomonas sp. CGMCC 1.13654]|uniref:Glutathione S-transferase family protein n=1 Tax=Sphingomonas chungangi TaxID=2683589 RepID=A0A838L4N6_9SPHN|nr:glutathione S-transferase family protein [Sphingomonas chungangi]MBA2933542.1 glutathione S-transferase family protein [Sphingomonas chungangi]MVW54875.1 glutathione S-transferase family protein [Sphingomonas chungangi]
MLKLHDSRLSGNAWKIRLLFAHLGIAYERVTLNLAEGPHKAPGFVAVNRFHRIPVVETEDGEFLVESCAILLHFADGTPLLPASGPDRAAAIEWLFYEQSDLARFLTYPRFFAMTGQAERQATVIAHYRNILADALRPVERALERGAWLLGDDVVVADFALYPYLKLSPEGGLDLAPWPAIRAWFDRFESLPRYEPLLPTL